MPVTTPPTNKRIEVQPGKQSPATALPCAGVSGHPAYPKQINASGLPYPIGSGAYGQKDSTLRNRIRRETEKRPYLSSKISVSNPY